MFNKNFRKDWNTFSGEIDILTLNHLELAFDKDCIGVGIEYARVFRTLYVKLLNIVIRIF